MWLRAIFLFSISFLCWTVKWIHYRLRIRWCASSSSSTSANWYWSFRGSLSDKEEKVETKNSRESLMRWQNKKNENIPPCDGSMQLVRCEGRLMLQISCERSVSCNSIKSKLQKGLDKSMYWFFGSKLHGAMVPSHTCDVRVLSRITFENGKFILWTYNGNKSLIDRIICLRLDFFSCAVASKVIYIEREPLSALTQTEKIVWFPSANVR